MQQPPYYQQPTYNYQPPQMPPPKRNIWQKFRALPIIVQVPIALFLIIFVGSAAISAAHDALFPVSGATLRPTQVVTQPTDVPTATQQAIKVPAGLVATSGVPRLGGSISDFIGKYGQPNGHTDITNGSYHFQRYADTTVVTDALIVQTDIFDAGMSEKVIGILYAPETGKVSCDAFLPSDADYKSQAPITSGNGYDKIYSSASLAQIFPASTFTDSNNNATTPGLFDVQFLIRTDGTADSCNVLVGTQQTK